MPTWYVPVHYPVTGAYLSPPVPRPLTHKESIHVKFVDDCSVAASINLKTSLIDDNDDLPRPITYHQRTGHKLADEHNVLQYELDRFDRFAKQSKSVVNEKKTEVMLFNFSKKYDFPPNFHIGESGILREVSVT